MDIQQYDHLQKRLMSIEMMVIDVLTVLNLLSDFLLANQPTEQAPTGLVAGNDDGDLDVQEQA